jgi:hypothetical protein
MRRDIDAPASRVWAAKRFESIYSPDLVGGEQLDRWPALMLLLTV